MNETYFRCHHYHIIRWYSPHHWHNISNTIVNFMKPLLILPNITICMETCSWHWWHYCNTNFATWITLLCNIILNSWFVPCWRKMMKVLLAFITALNIELEQNTQQLSQSFCCNSIFSIGLLPLRRESDSEFNEWNIFYYFRWSWVDTYNMFLLQQYFLNRILTTQKKITQKF